MPKLAIQTEGLTRDFRDLRAVDQLSITVERGTIFGFLGPNGAGKTTTIRLLLGLLEPTLGRAEVLGLDVQREADLIRSRTGALLEYSGLYERLSAEDNLEFYGRVWRLKRTERQARAKELLTHLELWERRTEMVGSWSRGMRQKLAIARALLHRPSLVFLDEPTAGLDPVAASVLHADLLSLAAREGVTVFLTTHNLPEVEQLCQQVAVIRQGKLLALGSPEALRSRAGSRRVEIEGSGFDERILALLRQRPEVRTVQLEGDRLLISLRDEHGAAPLVSLLVNAGVQIEEVHKASASLEEVFLALVTSGRMSDLWAILWKEWRELFRPGGSWRQGAWNDVAVVVGGLGIFIALANGRAWIEGGIVLYWIWFPLLQMTNVIADSFAGERERHTLETLLASRLPDNAILFGKMAAAVAYGWGLTLGSMAVGWLSVNLVYGRAGIVLYPADIALTVIVASLLGAILVAAGGVLVCLRSATVRQAYQRLSITLLVLFAPVFSLQYLPVPWRSALTDPQALLRSVPLLLGATTLLVALDLGLLVAARARFRRARLIG